MSRGSDSAFAVIVSGHPRVLVVQKSNGVWGLPGGGVEPGETPRTAVIREIREETGLRARGAEHVATLPRGGGRVYVFVLDKKRTRGKLVGRTDEIRRQRWVPPREALPLLTARNAARLEKALPHALRLVGDN